MLIKQSWQKHYIICFQQQFFLFPEKQKNSNFVKRVCDNLEVSITYSGNPLSEEECRRMFSNNPRFSTVGHGIKMYMCKKL